jgi:hypothetical protein
METEKSKDNVKSRLDQANLCDRPKYNIPKPKPRKRWKKPAAPYVLTKPQRKEVLQWFETLMFPDGYAANLNSSYSIRHFCNIDCGSIAALYAGLL